jgi:hypothetical protein
MSGNSARPVVVRLGWHILVLLLCNATATWGLERETPYEQPQLDFHALPREGSFKVHDHRSGDVWTESFWVETDNAGQILVRAERFDPEGSGMCYAEIALDSELRPIAYTFDSAELNLGVTFSGGRVEIEAASGTLKMPKVKRKLTQSDIFGNHLFVSQYALASATCGTVGSSPTKKHLLHTATGLASDQATWIVTAEKKVLSPDLLYYSETARCTDAGSAPLTIDGEALTFSVLMIEARVGRHEEVIKIFSDSLGVVRQIELKKHDIKAVLYK